MPYPNLIISGFPSPCKIACRSFPGLFPGVCKPRLHAFFADICNYASEDNKVFIGPEEFSGIAKRDYRRFASLPKFSAVDFP